MQEIYFKSFLHKDFTVNIYYHQKNFIDLFAGIGGFHLAIHDNEWNCVYASENDKFARQTYEHNFKNISPYIFENNLFNDDILEADPKVIPDHNLLCAGFPCQPFNMAGNRKSYEDPEGRGRIFRRLELHRKEMIELMKHPEN